MPTLKQTAQDYVPKQIKNVAELPHISVDMEVLTNTEAEFPYKFIEINGEEYKVPDSVVRDIKTMLEENPKLTAFKVKKAGEGRKIRYTVIPVTT